MRLLAKTLGLVGLTLSGNAIAAECAAVYTSDQLLTDLVEIEEMLKASDTAAPLARANQMEKGLGCMNETLPPILIGRVYRAIAGGFYYGGSQDRGQAWFRTAIEVDPGYIYGVEDIGASHSVRQIYDNLRAEEIPDAVAIDGRVLREGPRHVLDGRRLRSPAARLERPHLYQIDENGVKSWIIEGNAFPDDAFGAAAVVDASGADGKGSSKKTKEKKVKAPKEKKLKTAKVKEPKPEKQAKAKDPKPEKEAKAKDPKPEKEAKDPKPEKEAKVKDPKPEKVAKVKEPKVKKVKTQSVSMSSTVIIRDRPPEQIPLIVTGVVAILGSGGLYAASLMTKDKFGTLSEPNASDPVTERKLLQTRTAANRLFLGSLAVFAAGTGTLTYGIIIDGQAGGVMPTLNVRF